MAELAIATLQRHSSVTDADVIAKAESAAEERKQSAESDDKILHEIALRETRQSPPLMYLSNADSATLVAESTIECIRPETWFIKLKDPKDMYDAFFIVKGEAYVFNETGYLEMLPKGTFFGVDGALFHQRSHAIKAGEDLVVMRIPPEVLMKYLKKDAKLTLNLARNMLLKQNVLEGLNKFKNYVRQLRSGGLFDRNMLVKYYRGMHSALHPMCESTSLDVDAWLYANRRLPQNVTSTLVFFVTTKCPEILSHPDVALVSVKTSSRPRQIFQTMPGKCVAILRDLDTDLFDLVSNLCIHIVECEKLIRKLKSPVLFRDMLIHRNDQDKVLSILRTTELTPEEIVGLGRIWPDNLGEHLVNILMHYNDFSMSILSPQSHLKLDAIELWIKKLWFATAELLGLDPETSCESIPDEDMTIDILQVLLTRV